MICQDFLNDEEAEDSIANIREAVASILRPEPVSRELWTNSIREIYRLCTTHVTDKDHMKPFHDTIRQLITEHVEVCHERCSELVGVILLRTYLNQWQDFYRSAHYLDMICNSFNKTVSMMANIRFKREESGTISNARSLQPIGLNALTAWKNVMIPALLPLMTNSVVDVIRLNNPLNLDCECIVNVLESFNVLEGKIDKYDLSLDFIIYRKTEAGKRKDTLYTARFEHLFLSIIQTEMEIISQTLSATHSDETFIPSMLETMQSQYAICCRVLLRCSWAKIRTTIYKAFVSQQENVLRTLMGNAFQSRDVKALSNLYQMLTFSSGSLQVSTDSDSARMPFHKDFALAFQEFVVQQVKVRMLPQTENAHRYIEVFRQVDDEFRSLIDEEFNEDAGLSEEMQKGYQRVINMCRNPHGLTLTPAHLAKHMDGLLRGVKARTTDDTFESELDGCVRIFRFLDDKDVFQNMYSRLMAKRLLSGSVQAHHEEMAIVKMKEAHSHEFTTKMHRMMLDRKVSDDLSTEFQTHLAQQRDPSGNSPIRPGSGKIQSHFFILQRGSWPVVLNDPPAIDLPPALLDISTQFQTFYSAKFQGRSLHWAHLLSTVDMNLNYLSRSCIPTMSLYQAIVMLLFQDVDTLELQQISELSKLPVELLMNILKPLLALQLLLSDEEHLSPRTLVSLNLEFVVKRIRLRISAGSSAKEANEESAHVRTAVDEDRKLWVQATIVRVMKTRRTLSHLLLTQEVIQLGMSRFKPTVPMIKKGIDLLIEKEYIARSEGVQDEYVYLA